MLQERLRSEAVDGAMLVYPVDVYYFAGTRQNAVLWIPACGSPVLLVRKSLTRACKESLIDDNRPFPSGRELPGIIDSTVKKIGFTFDVLPVNYLSYYKNIFAGAELADISQPIRQIRSVKSPFEQKCLRISGRILMDIFSRVPEFMKPGMREVDVAAEFEYKLRKAGNATARMRAFGYDLTGLAVAGAAAAEPGSIDGPVVGKGLNSFRPCGASTEIIGPNVPILIDYAGSFSGYTVDATRMYVYGKLDEDMVNAFDIATEIQSWVAENLKPGVICEELYTGAIKIAEKAGLGDYFMGFPAEQARFIGHGVGLETDELPVLAKGVKDPLREGHAIAIEPKFLFPGKGAIGIENTWLVTSAGAEKLTGLTDEINYL
jgi:Xaa-Pro dipeptidase